MRALLAIPLLFVVQVLADEHQFVSPNGEFEAYTTAANGDGTGTKLYLRHTNSRDTGVLLRQNNGGSMRSGRRTHSSSLSSTTSTAISRMFMSFASEVLTESQHSSITRPDLHRYDVQWEVTGWDVARREVILEKVVKHEMPGRVTHEKVTGRLGTEPVKSEPND